MHDLTEAVEDRGDTITLRWSRAAPDEPGPVYEITYRWRDTDGQASDLDFEARGSRLGRPEDPPQVSVRATALTVTIATRAEMPSFDFDAWPLYPPGLYTEPAFRALALPRDVSLARPLPLFRSPEALSARVRSELEVAERQMELAFEGSDRLGVERERFEEWRRRLLARAPELHATLAALLPLDRCVPEP